MRSPVRFPARSSSIGSSRSPLAPTGQGTHESASLGIQRKYRVHNDGRLRQSARPKSKRKETAPCSGYLIRWPIPPVAQPPVAERADRRSAGGLLLTRPAYYLIGFDASPGTTG